jgi:hypothetical protein
LDAREDALASQASHVWSDGAAVSPPCALEPTAPPLMAIVVRTTGRIPRYGLVVSLANERGVLTCARGWRENPDRSRPGS